MAFVFKVSNEKIQGQDAVPAGLYDVKLVSFNPKMSKKGDSVNYNPCMEIVNHPDFAGRKVFDSLNTGAAWILADFANCFGVPLETDGTDSWLAGDFASDPAKFVESDPSTWVYAGPMLGRSGKVELIVDTYNNKESNKVGKNGYIKNPSLG